MSANMIKNLNVLVVMQRQKKDAAEDVHREKKKNIHLSYLIFFPSLSLQFSERKRPKVKVISRSRSAGQRLSPGAQHDVSQHGERTDGVVSAATRAACRNRPACTVRTASQGGSGQQLVRLGAAGLPVPGDV